MSKKRSSADGKTGQPPAFIDRRAMEKTMSDIGRLLSEHEFSSTEEMNAFLNEALASGKPPATLPRTPVEQAQDLMYEAWNSTGQKRVKLALQALEISKDCADAYVLLAEESARSLNEAKDLYELGVKAGERALGPQTFEENVGDFWGMMETRPYMRARAGLAACLWQLGERQQAIEHYADMLRLNPGDNQGLRYTLATALLEEGADEALGELLKQYEDDAAAAWSYNRALWIFRQKGASSQANRALKKALEANPFVPSYLLGRKRLPKRLPEYIGFGDESEAVDYVIDAIPAWQKTAGALEWLASQLAAATNHRLSSGSPSRG